MPVSYAKASKSKYRVTLDLEVQEDFNPHNIDWERVLDFQRNERVNLLSSNEISKKNKKDGENNNQKFSNHNIDVNA